MPPPSFGSGAKVEPTRLRQIALVVEDLEKAKRLLTKVLGTEVVYIDPGVGKWGLENFLVPLGGDLIEVVSPKTLDKNTTAGRLLQKRGDGGYMIIMQNLNALARRKAIEAKGHKVIWGYEHDDVVCVQYHPKGIKGGMMPELDSHSPVPENPTPLVDSFSPWHACGKDYAKYSEKMKKYADLHLVGALLRLAPGDIDTEAAARQWKEIFGVDMSRDLLAFTNVRMGFVRGQEGKSEGLESITVAVNGKDRFNKILQLASEEGLCGDGWINMCGVKWYFVLAGDVSGKAVQSVL